LKDYRPIFASAIFPLDFLPEFRDTALRYKIIDRK
jgi:hypothetical protein